MVHEPIAFRASPQFVAALGVCHVAGVVPEIELHEIAVQVGFAQVLERAVHAALEKGEIGLRRVRVPDVAVHVFLGAVVDGAVVGELLADSWIDRAVVRHQA